MESACITTNQNFRLYKIVATHYLCAAVTFLALVPMFMFSLADFTSHYFHPHLLAITHTAALGWASIIVFGICYQFIPIIFKTELYSYKLAWLGLLSFYMGLIELVYSFWVFEPGLHMQGGSLLLLLAIGLFTANIQLTAQKLESTTICQDFVLTASVWLLFTAVLGVLMVFNFRFPFLPQDHLVFLKIHAHGGFVGWFMLLAIGVSSSLLKIDVAHSFANSTLLKWSFYLINFGLLLFYINAYVFGVNIATYAIILVGAVGVFCWLTYVYQCISFYNSVKLMAKHAHISLSVVLLILAIAILPFIIFYQLKADVLAIRLTNVYGSLLLFGWISSLLLGQTFEALAALSKGLNFDASIISPKNYTLNAYRKRVVNAQFIAFTLFITCFCFGLALAIKPLVYFGVICFSATAVLYSGNIFITLFRNAKTQ